MHKDDFYKILSRYLIGKADKYDVKKLQDWLNESDENRNLFHSITEYWDTETNYFSKGAERVAKKLESRIADLDLENGKKLNIPDDFKQVSTPKRKFSILKLSVAATLLVLLTVSYFFRSYLGQFIDSPAIDDNKYIERLTDSGEKINIKLPDGSLVKLNSNGKLIFPERFSDEERKITLVGEAFFEVAKDSLRPFSVISGGISTRVFGTSFNIRAFPEENSIAVAVVSGKVAVRSLDSKDPLVQPVLLGAEEMAVYSKENKQTTLGTFDYMEVVAWKDGIIYFRDATIDEIFDRLEQWYGVTFIINRELNRKRGFTVSYQNKSLEAVLEGLGFSYGFQFEIDNKNVYIN